MAGILPPDALHLESGSQIIQNWYHTIFNQADNEKYQVVSLTRVKNLNSDWVHEYLQFIVEKKETGGRCRIFAERLGNHPDSPAADRITYGQPSKIDDLPLPLQSLTFNEPRPPLIGIVEILNEVSGEGGKYEFRGKNCFWFANQSYMRISRKFEAQKKHWRLLNLGGIGGGRLRDLWAYTVPRYILCVTLKPGAEAFRAGRDEALTWSGEPVTIVTLADAVKQATNELLDTKTLEKYIQWLQEQCCDGVDRDMIQRETETVNLKAERRTKQAEPITWIEDYNKELDDFVARVLNNPETGADLAAYQAEHACRNIGAEQEVEYNGPGGHQNGELDKAMRAFEGRVLRKGLTALSS